MTTFIDTGFLLAIILRDDALHDRAVAWDAALTGDCITTEFIFLEFADALSAPLLRGLAQEMLDRMRQDPLIEIIPADSQLFAAGYELFCQRSDKGWSLTDCTSLQIMRTRAITDALTHDHHFEQAGFRALLRADPPSN